MVPPTDNLAFDYTAMQDALSGAQTSDEINRAIVDTPFRLCRPQAALIFLGITVLLEVNTKSHTIDRIALSETELARNTTQVSYVPFEAIKIPVDDPDNIIAKALRSGMPQDTTDWRYLFTPALTAEQARINQASGGIAFSAVYPVDTNRAIIFSYYQYQQHIGKAQRDFMDHYTALVRQKLAA
ncbi:MAG TPA: hypothetical protein VFN56_01965 [Candidatus Saccharimonadales bacterium]|nr:hypothetical protein [Candidatus Saccharimonadales bacterium]